VSDFELHPEAYTDVDDLWEYIAEDSLDSADRVREKIYDAIQFLVPFPNKGHRRPDLTSRPLRFWRVYDYLIAYAPNERPLWILAIIHGSRSPRVMAAILRSREERNM
jgi:plasmid stabilization system protein ParE